MRLLVSGDREWDDSDLIIATLLVTDSYTPITLLIEGGARGADRIAGLIADQRDWLHLPQPAEWNRYGKGAGPIRNQQMLDLGPDLVLAFHDDIDNSKGTKDMVTRAREAGVMVRLVAHGDREGKVTVTEYAGVYAKTYQ